MAETDRSTVSEFNAQVIAEFRANEGRVGGSLADTPILLLHHVGAKSTTERVTPVAYNALGDRAFVIVASNGGSATHPGWYCNLKANPRIEVEVGTERFTAFALELDRAARAEVWPTLIEAAPAIGQFQAQTTRQIPVFVLSREDSTAGGSERGQRPQAEATDRLCGVPSAGALAARRAGKRPRLRDGRRRWHASAVPSKEHGSRHDRR